MARLILAIAMVLIGGWLFFNLGDSMQHVQDNSKDYAAAIDMINDLEAPAAGDNR